MATTSVFLDTSFIIALYNVRDPYHRKATLLDDQMAEQRRPILLHAGILLEIGDGFSRLDRRQRETKIVAGIMSDKTYAVVSIDELLLEEACEFYCSRPDKTWGLTDCASFRLMEALHISEALTSDIHFVQSGFRALLLED